MQLYSLRARYYNPLQGRFLSRDKHTGNYQNELNRYVYTANNPVMFGDPSGMNMTGLGVLLKERAKQFKQAYETYQGTADGMISGLLGHTLANAIIGIIDALIGVPTRDPIANFQARMNNIIDITFSAVIGGFIGGQTQNIIDRYTGGCSGCFDFLHAFYIGFGITFYGAFLNYLANDLFFTWDFIPDEPVEFLTDMVIAIPAGVIAGFVNMVNVTKMTDPTSTIVREKASFLAGFVRGLGSFSSGFFTALFQQGLDALYTMSE